MGFAQNPAVGIPDSVANLPYPGSNGAYTIFNPLTHNGTQFSNPPITTTCFSNCNADYLFFSNFGLNVPTNAIVTGFEVIHSRGGCNSGSYMIDSVFLVSGFQQSTAKRDSASNSTTDTLGGPLDLWGMQGATGNMVASPNFGVLIKSTGSGICTFAQNDVRLRVYYCTYNLPATGIPDSVANVSRLGSNGSYTISNPLAHNGSVFTNPPISVNCFNNCESDYLYFHDLDLSPMPMSPITGIEVEHSHGGCNSGSFAIDTLQLCLNGQLIGVPKWDSASSTTTTTLGSNVDTWGVSNLSTADVLDPSFGIKLFTTGTGICTFGQFNLVVRVFHCFENVLAVNDPLMGYGLVVYPNPVSNRLRWRSEEELVWVGIVDLVGKWVTVPQADQEIDVSSLPSGIYLFVATTVTGQRLTRKFEKLN